MAPSRLIGPAPRALRTDTLRRKICSWFRHPMRVFVRRMRTGGGMHLKVMHCLGCGISWGEPNKL